MEVNIVHFYELNENFGRALENDGDDEVWKMIQQENFILSSFVQFYQYDIEFRTLSELSTTQQTNTNYNSRPPVIS